MQEVNAVGLGLHRVEQPKRRSSETQENSGDRERHRRAEGRKGETIGRVPPKRWRFEIRYPIVVRIDQKQDYAIGGKRKGEPHHPAPCQRAIFRKQPGAQAGLTDPDAGQEISGIEQDATGLDRQRIMAGHQPG